MKGKHRASAIEATILYMGNRFEEAWKMEQPLPDLPQRPDLLHEHLAVEIQCSSLKSVRLQERIDGYAQKKLPRLVAWQTAMAQRKIHTSAKTILFL